MGRPPAARRPRRRADGREQESGSGAAGSAANRRADTRPRRDRPARRPRTRPAEVAPGPPPAAAPRGPRRTSHPARARIATPATTRRDLELDVIPLCPGHRAAAAWPPGASKTGLAPPAPESPPAREPSAERARSPPFRSPGPAPRTGGLLPGHRSSRAAEGAPRSPPPTPPRARARRCRRTWFCVKVGIRRVVTMLIRAHRLSRVVTFGVATTSASPERSSASSRNPPPLPSTEPKRKPESEIEPASAVPTGRQGGARAVQLASNNGTQEMTPQTIAHPASLLCPRMRDTGAEWTICDHFFAGAALLARRRLHPGDGHDPDRTSSTAQRRAAVWNFRPISTSQKADATGAPRAHSHQAPSLASATQ